MVSLIVSELRTGKRALFKDHAGAVAALMPYSTFVFNVLQSVKGAPLR